MTSAPSAEDQTAQVVASADTTSPDANAAASSPAEDQGAKPETMLDAVVAAVKGESKAEESPAPEGSTGTDAQPDGQAAEANAEDADRKAEEADQKLPFHKHPRWQEMKEANRALRNDVKALTEARTALEGQIQTFKEGHEQFQSVVRYMEASNLTSEEVNTGFEIMRLMKNDPEKALAALMPYVGQLQTVTGQVLPAELKAQVEQGVITEEAALELSRSRSREALASHAAETARRQVEQIQTRQTVDSFAKTVESAVARWEQAWSTSPDYKTLQPHVMERIELELLKRQTAGALPRTAEEAVQIAEQCKAEVEKKLRAFLPNQKREIRPVTGGGSVQATAKPATMLEAVSQALKAG